MPAVQCSCPSCQTLLQIAQAPPVQVRCPCCGSVFLVGAAPVQPAAPVAFIPVQPAGPPAGSQPGTPAYVPLPAPPSGKSRGPSGGFVMLVGGGVLLLLTAGLVLILNLVFGGPGKGRPAAGA